MTLHLTAAEFAVLRRTVATIFDYVNRSPVTADLLGIDRSSRATIERILREMDNNRRNRAPQNKNTKQSNIQ